MITNQISLTIVSSITNEFNLFKFFFHAGKIDENFSNWGENTQCDWSLYLPIFQCCFGIIMTSFFIICGKGGKSNEHSFLMQPWRIVIPALIFFLFMFIISILQIHILHGGMNVFCDNLTQNDQNISCYDALNAFVISPVDYETNNYYIALQILDWVIFSLWLFLATIMLIRIIFVIDFQLVRVTIRTCEYDNASEKSAFKVVPPKTEKDGKEKTTQF